MARRKLGDRVFGKYAIDDPMDVFEDTWLKLEMAFFALAMFAFFVLAPISMLLSEFNKPLYNEGRIYFELFFYYLGQVNIIYYGFIAAVTYIVGVFAAWMLRICLNLISEIVRAK